MNRGLCGFFFNFDIFIFEFFSAQIADKQFAATQFLTADIAKIYRLCILASHLRFSR